jgi:multiple antibiotic resistance protein
MAFSFLLLALVAVVLGLGVIFMLGSRLVRKIFRDTGVRVIERIMGILLAGMSVQFVYNGLVKLEILPL